MEAIFVKDAEGKIVELTVGGKTIKVGDRVRPGPDWKWCNQNGGGEGVVTAIDDDQENPLWAEVEWDKGKIDDYRWGEKGKFDLEVIPADGKHKNPDSIKG